MCGTTRRCGRDGSSCCPTCWPPSTPTGRSTTSPTSCPGCSTGPPRYRQTRGEPRAALPLLQRAYAINRARLGDDHPDTLASANNLATDLRALGEYQQARDLDEDTLARRRRVLGDDHPDTLASANNLAATCARWVSYQQARNLDEDTLTRAPAGPRRRPPRHPHLGQQPRRRPVRAG